MSEIDETEAEETPAPIIDEKEPEGTAAPTVEKTGAEEVPASTEEPAEEGSSAKVNSIATFAARESYSVKVGKTVTLRGTRNPWRCDYTQEWQSSNAAVASVSDSGVVTGNSAGTVTISHTYCSSDYWSDFSWHHNVQTETFTVTVTEPVAPTGITLTGADTVKVYDSIQLTASLTPSNAEATLAWQSDDESVLTVDANGKVTGKSVGTATVTVYAGTVSAQKTITVTAAEEEVATAKFFYVKSPSSDPASNDVSNWNHLGDGGTVNRRNIVWTDINNYEMSRVLSWPDGSTGSTYEAPRGSDAWNTIYRAFKNQYEGIDSEDDVEKIVITPYKISNNNDGLHVDCTVEIVAKSVYSVRYNLLDAGATDWTVPEFYALRAAEGLTTKPQKTYPERKTEDGKVYKFYGWYLDKNLSQKVKFPYSVTGNVDFYAKYMEEQGYSVTYVLNGGKWNNTSVYDHYENDVVYVTSTVPTKEGYTFKGWTYSEDDSKTYQKGNSFKMPAKDVTLKAQWNINKYTVKWVDDDETTLIYQKDYEYGAMPQFEGVEPTKAADAQYTYTFKGWNKDYTEVKGNQTYVAVYDKAVNKYTVKWVDDDETTLIYQKDYEYGAMPQFEGVEPTKAADAQYTYTFKGWNKDYTEVKGNQTYVAVYEKTTNKYTVKWVDEDGTTLIDQKDYEYGAIPKFEGVEPTKAADAQYTYTFKGWDKDYTEVKGNQTYVAVYEKTTNKYTVKWVDEDGTTLIDQKDYEYGAIPKFEGVEPTKAADAQYTYTFKGWDKDYTEVKGNQTYVAVYEKTTNKYNVTYDLDGGEWTEATNEFPYEYKATVEVIKTVPTREGYKFSDWRSEEVTIENDAFTMPAKDVVLKAVWEANPTPTPIPSEEPTPTPAPTEEPTPTPAPTEEPTPTPAPTEEPTPTPAPTEEPTPTPAPTEEPTPTPAPTEEPTPTPAPNPNPNPATPTPTPVAPVVPATVATPTPKPTATPSTTPSDNGGKGDGNNDGEIGETINDNETPLANGEDIADNATPLAGLGTGAWALINLILTIVTTLLSILLLIGYIGKKKKALEDEDGNVVLDENGKEVMEYEKNKKGLWRLISIIPALIAIIVFIFTEDMTLPMIFVDKWTILHVVIALVQVVVMVLCKKKKDENDEDENVANA